MDPKQKNRSYNELADLHIHTNHSDGELDPEVVVERAVAAGLRAISITDHDGISAVEPAQAAGEVLGLEVIPGIELSTRDGNNELHILGYFIDIRNEDLNRFIKVLQKDRFLRAKKIVQKLDEIDISIHMDMVIQRAGHGAIGRPHIAEVLLEEGFVLSFDEAFYRFLGTGKPAFVPNYAISPKEAIDLIHDCHGLAFVAHPYLGIEGENLDRLVEQGLDGIEILHPRFRETQVSRLYKLAIDHRLLVSGGSDYHGDRNGARLIGEFNVPYRFVVDMKKRVGQTGGS